METYDIISLVFSGLSAIGTLVAGFGAIFAVAQIRKHWRDDDTFATFFADYQSLKIHPGGKSYWYFNFRVVNSGKVDFSVGESTFADKRLDKLFELRNAPRTDYPLSQGAYVEHRAYIVTKENGISFPEEIAIEVASAERKTLGKIIVKKADSRTTIHNDMRKPV